MNKGVGQNVSERPPVVVIMGHIDHGKSTLLDYIRKTNITGKEAGGITQHLGAYEVLHETKDGKKKSLTFLDTPGHEAFKTIRSRGASAADMAILIVSAEDGVKPQTVEAYECIKKSELPFIVAINKVDKPSANVEKTKQDLAENDIYLEGYGGKVSWVPISAKTGVGISDLLDLLILSAELENFTGDKNQLAEGVIIESNLDTKKGISATAVIKNGTLKKGQFAVSGKSYSPLRMVEDYLGKPVSEVSFSSPLRIIGWNKLPHVGDKFTVASDKKEALEKIADSKSETARAVQEEVPEGKVLVPIIIKADTSGSLEAIKYELSKLKNDRIMVKVVVSEIGQISENDIKVASVNENAIVLGFNTTADAQAKNLSERLGVKVEMFNIIYKLTEWLEKALQDRTPTIEVEETIGQAKILKFFSKTKDKQVVGGKVQSGSIKTDSLVKILRRDIQIGKGKVKGLQIQKTETDNVSEGNEFGALIDSKSEIAPGDIVEAFEVVKK